MTTEETNISVQFPNVAVLIRLIVMCLGLAIGEFFFGAGYEHLTFAIGFLVIGVLIN